MQDRYAGDIGDYLKLALLRSIAQDKSLGVAWWLYPDGNHNGDGRHISYLHKPEIWRYVDPTVFDALHHMVNSGARSVQALEDLNVLDGAIYHRTLLDFPGTPAERRRARMNWFENLKKAMANRDLLFLDPDNGFEPKGFSTGSKRAGKSVSIDEAIRLTEGDRTVVVYHHQTRMPGGHHAELAYWAQRLRSSGCGRVDVIRMGAFSPRAYFVLNASRDIRRTLQSVAAEWAAAQVTWHPQSD